MYALRVGGLPGTKASGVGLMVIRIDVAGYLLNVEVSDDFDIYSPEITVWWLKRVDPIVGAKGWIESNEFDVFDTYSEAEYATPPGASLMGIESLRVDGVDIEPREQ